MVAGLQILDRVKATLGAPHSLYAVADSFAQRGAHRRAFTLFVEAAQSGLPQAQSRLGQCYLHGLGVPPSISEALRWLRRAADGGDASAQTQLAELALQGIDDRPPTGLFDAPGVAGDYARAEHWCREAMARGSAEAKALLAFILINGPEERRDPDAADALYREAAAAGRPKGWVGLALLRLREGTQESTDEAHALLDAAAAEGLPVAHHLLGVLLESGTACAVDLPAAAEHYRIAAELGHIAAQVRYGFALLNGRGVAQDAFSAETLLRRAGLAGDAQAAAVVGYLYARDGDLPPNYAEATMWLRRAADAGHTAAARTLGHMLMLGIGIPKDIPEAARWLCMAASHGDEAARADLVLLALTHQLDADDQQMAIDLLRAAAEAGDAEAE